MDGEFTASGDGTALSFTYDAEGIRSTQKAGSTTHTYVTQSGKVMREGYSTTVMDFIYDVNGRPFALRNSSDSDSTFHTYDYVLNLQGDVVALYDYIAPTSSQAVVRYTYNAWGELLAATTTSTCTTPDLATIPPSATVATTTIPKQASIMHPAVITILRSVGGSMQMILSIWAQMAHD